MQKKTQQIKEQYNKQCKQTQKTKHVKNKN